MSVSTTDNRLTRHRRVVREIVSEQPRHLTAAEIFEEVRRRDARMAVGTVYNALHYLVHAGLVAEVRRPDGVVAYDRETRPHDHLVCRLCGRLDDAPAVGPSADLAAAYAPLGAGTGYAVESHRVVFTGVCPPCSMS